MQQNSRASHGGLSACDALERVLPAVGFPASPDTGRKRAYLCPLSGETEAFSSGKR